MPTIYKSTDPSAPVLVGGVSSLINLLDKCLVDGYGSKTAAGWTKPFTGTDLAAFRNSVAAGGTGMHVLVDDSGAGTGGARSARARAYLTMSSISVGTIPTPNSTQLPNGIVWRKSQTVDSTPRPWILIADALTFYLCVDTGTVSPPGSAGGEGTYAAGDFASLVPSDPYRFFIAGRPTQDTTSQGNSLGLMNRCSSKFGTPAADGFFLGRGFAGTGDPVPCGIPSLSDATALGFGIGSSGGVPAAAAPGSGLRFWIPAFIGCEGTIRGRLRGVYASVNSSDGVAIGAEFVNPPGITATLVSIRHGTHEVFYDPTFDAHLFVDRTSTSW